MSFLRRQESKIPNSGAPSHNHNIDRVAASSEQSEFGAGLNPRVSFKTFEFRTFEFVSDLEIRI